MNNEYYNVNRIYKTTLNHSALIIIFYGKDRFTRRAAERAIIEKWRHVTTITTSLPEGTAAALDYPAPPLLSSEHSTY